MDLRVTTSLVFWSLLILVPALTEGSVNVNLVATDENGKTIDHLSPGTTMTLNCTYTVDPLYVNLKNGTDWNIFVKNFGTGKGKVGPGFEKLVKSNSSGDGWVSIKFGVPYCYKDEVIKCQVLDQLANKFEDKREFPIGSFQQPTNINGTNCNEIIEIEQDEFEFNLTCAVSEVQPEVTFTWSVGCIETSIVSAEDTTKCFFNRTSTATCQMDTEEMNVTCAVGNSIGQGNCTITIKNEIPTTQPPTTTLETTTLETTTLETTTLETTTEETTTAEVTTTTQATETTTNNQTISESLTSTETMPSSTESGNLGSTTNSSVTSAPTGPETTTTPKTDGGGNGNEEPSGDDLGLIIGLSVGGVLLVGAVIGVVFYLKNKRNKPGRKAISDSESTLDPPPDYEGTNNSTNPYTGNNQNMPNGRDKTGQYDSKPEPTRRVSEPSNSDWDPNTNTTIL